MSGVPTRRTDIDPGHLPQSDRVGVVQGGPGITVAASGIVGSAVVGPASVLYRLRCLVAGTVTLYDNTAASGTVILPATAMTAGQVIEIGEVLDVGLYATVAGGGSFRVVVAPNA